MNAPDGRKHLLRVALIGPFQPRSLPSARAVSTIMPSLKHLLLERGLASQEHIAQSEAAEQEADIGGLLVRLGIVPEEALLQLLSEQLKLPLLAPGQVPGAESIRDVVTSLGIPTSWCVNNQIALWREEGVLAAAGPRISTPWIQEAMESWTEPPERQYLATTAAIEPHLLSLRSLTGFYANPTDTTRLFELAEDTPVISFVDSLFAEALTAGASDIHLEPFEDRVTVRYRIDGVLVQRRVTSLDAYGAISSRIKLLSKMDIAESRLPQDGRQTVRIAARDVDMRVSTLPTSWGESIVIRLLGKTQTIPPFTDLGLHEPQARTLMEAASRPNGLILLTGPTGSGKTTTVYRLISLLNDGKRKIVTIEDPVEFDLPGVLQMNVRPDIALDFAAGLRSVLRQDPDVIFVGEIRDAKTASIAVQAALTGHLVISTLHTNSALSAMPRLVDLGVESFLLADVLRATVGQRLLRRVCDKCATPIHDPAQESRARGILPAALREAEPSWRTGVGCANCSGSGFRGRVGVFEVAPVTPALQNAIRTGAATSELELLAREAGFTTLLENGTDKARRGVTTFPEALRVLDAAVQ